MRDDFVKKGVTLRYSYFDKDKQPIASVGRPPTGASSASPREAFFSRAAHDLNHAIANSESTIFAASPW
jgi:hypothetical protein